MGIRSVEGLLSLRGQFHCGQSRRSVFNEGACSQRQDRRRELRLQHHSRFAMMADLVDAGKALYEERLKLLEGLWMPAAPPWEDLPDDVKARWRSYAEGSGPQP